MLPPTAMIIENDLRWQLPKRFDALSRIDIGKIAQAGKQNTNLKNIVLDFGNCDYLDSSALGLLIVLRSELSDRGIPIKFINLRKTVKDIIKISNFDKLFTIFW